MSSSSSEWSIWKWLASTNRDDPQSLRSARTVSVGIGMILGPIIILAATFGLAELEYAAILGIPLGSILAVVLISISILLCFLLCVIAGNKSATALGFVGLLCVPITIWNVFIRITTDKNGIIDAVGSIIGWSSFLPGMTGLFMGAWFATWLARRNGYLRQRAYLRKVTKRAEKIAKAITEGDSDFEREKIFDRTQDFRGLFELEELSESLSPTSLPTKEQKKLTTQRMARRILSNRLVSDPFEPRPFSSSEQLRTTIPAFLFALMLAALSVWQASGALIGGPMPPVYSSHPPLIMVASGVISFIACFLLTLIGSYNSLASGAAALFVLLIPAILQAFIAILTSRVVVPGDFWAISTGLASPLMAVWGGFALTLSLSSNWAWNQGTARAAQEWLKTH